MPATVGCYLQPPRAAFSEGPRPVRDRRIHLALPWPPSVNHYWRLGGHGRIYISEEGRRFRRSVRVLVSARIKQPLRGRLSLEVYLHGPLRDRRGHRLGRRSYDIDNRLKALLDALEHGGAFGDDEQIDAIQLERATRVEGGRTQVYMTEVHENGD